MILNVFGVFLSLVHIFIFFVLFYFFKGGNCVTSLQSSSMNTCPGQPPHWPYGFTGKARQEMGWPVWERSFKGNKLCGNTFTYRHLVPKRQRPRRKALLQFFEPTLFAKRRSFSYCITWTEGTRDFFSKNASFFDNVCFAQQQRLSGWCMQQGGEIRPLILLFFFVRNHVAMLVNNDRLLSDCGEISNRSKIPVLWVAQK